MAKCVSDHETGKVSRVSDSLAHRLVSDREASYVPKSAWKAQTREQHLSRKEPTLKEKMVSAINARGGK